MEAAQSSMAPVGHSGSCVALHSTLSLTSHASEPAVLWLQGPCFPVRDQHCCGPQRELSATSPTPLSRCSRDSRSHWADTVGRLVELSQGTASAGGLTGPAPAGEGPDGTLTNCVLTVEIRSYLDESFLYRTHHSLCQQGRWWAEGWAWRGAV